MGRGRRRGAKKNFGDKRRERQKNKDEWDKRPQRHYEDMVRDNKDFETFYKAQRIVPEDQWPEFLSKMKENLPVAFRITAGSRAETKALSKIIQGDFFTEILNAKLDSTPDDEPKVKPHRLPFYPEGLAWQLQLTRKDIRRSEAYFRLHNFLIAETSSGSISRQEVVSMIPPLVLDVKPDHKVLDMCAAPGSKTAQLIEMIHADEGNPHPKGFVIANDVDNNRCYMLVHQAKRLNSPNILITNHDSSVMPNFRMTSPDGSEGILKFDRILADVPCTGDGTMRKNPDIWCKWNPANGHNLHGIQFRIAKRGLEMLAVGGRMVYSTCSLNPLENEAVLHRLLCETGDSVRLVDGREFVPGLVCNPGVSHWVACSKDMKFYETFEEVPEQWQTLVRPKMFPPKPEEAGRFHLEKCMRILPHHQDTGGFFVAVLEKVKALPWEREREGSPQDGGEGGVKRSGEQDKAGPERKKKRMFGYREDPFVFFKDEEEVWPAIKEFYSISDDLDPRCLLVRCQEGKKKNIYFTSPAIRDIVLLNENNVKMINTGVKTFVRCDNKNMKCAFRLAQEGMPSILSYIGENRKVKIGREDLVELLQNDNPQTPPEIAKLSEEIQKGTVNIDSGSCILIYEESDAENLDPLKLVMVGWRGTMSLRAYVPLHDAVHYLRLLGADFSKFEKNKFEENRNANKTTEGEDDTSIFPSNEENLTDEKITDDTAEDVIAETT
ncbi:tRNA (cytosine(34)-C(5))-methyltransferase [Diachasma alloeum]|uniref:tRNA (cytosine(34)-C(5))-methyltransferase n=1 Tax=Diachasma alloeum TaxID=454923 RepID=UPI0007383F8A|nr:tRNA (cytosine(34)-C(5))-methyltransferase [Diachasma alloeum]